LTQRSLHSFWCYTPCTAQQAKLFQRSGR